MNGKIQRCIWVVILVSTFLSSTVFAIDFAGTSSGIFENPTGPAGMVTTGTGTSYFTWGIGVGSSPSSLQFSGGPFSGFFEQEFSFGTLTYFNGATQAGTEANTVNLNTTLGFTSPSVTSQQFNFTFDLINTPNVGTPEEQADIVGLAFPFDPFHTVNLGGTDYFLQFTRFGNPGPGGITTVDEFRVLEGATASAQLFGKLTESPQVPEPATMLLLGSGLIGLAGYARKKLKK